MRRIEELLLAFLDRTWIWGIYAICIVTVIDNKLANDECLTIWAIVNSSALAMECLWGGVVWGLWAIGQFLQITLQIVGIMCFVGVAILIIWLIVDSLGSKGKKENEE